VDQLAMVSVLARELAFAHPLVMMEMLALSTAALLVWMVLPAPTHLWFAMTETSALKISVCLLLDVISHLSLALHQIFATLLLAILPWVANSHPSNVFLTALAIPLRVLLPKEDA
jgi:hypothetical protein